jgi:hypothetical protein
MSYYIYFESNGRICAMTNGEASYPDCQSICIGDNPIDVINYYVENNQAVLFPDKPNNGNYWDFDYSNKVWIGNSQIASTQITDKRQILLQQSDWTQLPNGPLTAEQQQAWAVYRQELRDITSQSGYPFNVIWPTPPQG